MSTLDVPLTLLDPEGGWINAPVHVHDLHGRPVLLHFWNERDVGSRARLPQFKALIEEFQPRGLQVISVHVPLPGEALERAMDTNRLELLTKRLGFHHPVATDDGSMALAYGVDGSPSYLVYDARLVMRLRVTGEESVEAVLRPLLEQLTRAESLSQDAHAP
ncbi:TlpA disulfide reductase family protein [Melittangium boletus]|uniref:TlpA disulfide reductase family protein n=1 Tax=Melittangium boletus TaxID=83453 RepID=UPI003DA5F0C6